MLKLKQGFFLYLKLDESRIVWVFFIYKGVFRFCKECRCTETTRGSAIYRLMMRGVSSIGGCGLVKIMVVSSCKAPTIFSSITTWFVGFMTGLYSTIHKWIYKISYNTSMKCLKMHVGLLIDLHIGLMGTKLQPIL